MKKITICLLLILFISLGCTKEDNSNKNNKKEEKEPKEEMSEIDKKVEETLKNMTIDEKIGQMMIIFYTKDYLDNTLKSALTDIQPGGFILFKDNITTYERTLDFVKNMKGLVKIPMFISIDEEGGKIQRLTNLYGSKITYIPDMYDLGLKDDKELTYEVGKVLAEELMVFGINMDFAPVIDVYSNPDNKSKHNL